LNGFEKGVYTITTTVDGLVTSSKFIKD
jgi:hypothetical protein